MTEKNMIVYLKNPWSGRITETTWNDVEIFCQENVHPNDRKLWLEEARKAAEAGDDDTLGKMIIGS